LVPNYKGENPIRSGGPGGRACISGEIPTTRGSNIVMEPLLEGREKGGFADLGAKSSEEGGKMINMELWK